MKQKEIAEYNNMFETYKIMKDVFDKHYVQVYSYMGLPNSSIYSLMCITQRTEYSKKEYFMMAPNGSYPHKIDKKEFKDAINYERLELKDETDFICEVRDFINKVYENCEKQLKIKLED